MEGMPTPPSPTGVSDPLDDGEHLDLTGGTGSYRFMAPEVYQNEKYVCVLGGGLTSNHS